MELSWLSRLRLALAIATGIVLLAVVAGPLLEQPDPYSPVTFFERRLSAQTGLTLGALAFAAGFIAYWLAWPYGREMAVVAAPAGLAVIAMRGGSVTDLFRSSPEVSTRIAAYASFRWEAAFWLLIVLAGIAGSFAAGRIRSPSDAARRNAVDPADRRITREPAVALNGLLALALSTAIAYIGLAVFVKAVPTPTMTGTVSSQPLPAQIACGTMLAFGVAAFAIKLAFRFDWSIPVGAILVTNFLVMSLASSPALVSEMAAKWPPAVLAQAPFGILPIQMVAYGTLGSLLGYWLAVRYNIWRAQLQIS
jgi:hypothetical protein